MDSSFSLAIADTNTRVTAVILTVSWNWVDVSSQILERFKVERTNLQELSNRIIYGPTPRDCFDNGREVVVHEDNQGCFLGNLRARDSHRETNVGRSQRRSIIRPVTCNS